MHHQGRCRVVIRPLLAHRRAVFYPQLAMDDLLNSAKALTRLVRSMDPAEWGDALAYTAPEVRQLARAIQATEECVKRTGEVSAQLGE